MVAIRRPPQTPQGTLVAPFTEGDLSPMDPNARAHSVGPFVLVAYFDSAFGPGEAPKDLDVRPHPHIGIATLTYLLSGSVTHRDDLGNVAEIAPGDVAWMISGRGVVHSERFPVIRERGGRLCGFQIWVALTDEEVAPSFDLLPTDPVVSEGAKVRHLLGPNARAAQTPFSPMWMSHAELEPGAPFLVPEGAEAAIFVIDGAIEIGGKSATAGETVSLEPSDARRCVARERANVLCFGGDPIGPRYLWWNYLHSKKARIDEAKAAWKSGRLPLPPDDRDEFIPLPADHERPLRIINAP